MQSLDPVLLPGHAAPHVPGQLRVRRAVPGPHGSLQAPHGAQAAQAYGSPAVRGRFQKDRRRRLGGRRGKWSYYKPTEQSMVLLSDPGHEPHVPPPHVRVRVMAPFPHVVLHVPLTHDDHTLGVPEMRRAYERPHLRNTSGCCLRYPSTCHTCRPRTCA